MVDSKLLFRRQFLLTPEVCSDLIHWQHLTIGHYNLYAHPELALTIKLSSDTDVSATLIGYIIDPANPEQTNSDALRAIVSLAHTTEKISDYLNTVSGRFVIIIKTLKDILVFHDPCGLRTVYYTKYKGKIFIGSQPYIFKYVMPLEKGDRFTSYFKSKYANSNLEHWLPSGCSLFEDVHHLVPNHYLVLSTLEQVRYWPTRKLSRMNIDDAVMEISTLLEKLMISANKRFKLALPLTAGWDSRVLLSTSNKISKDVFFYTLQYRNLNAKSNDIRIPINLLHSLNIQHNLIDCRKIISEEFQELYLRNTPLAHIDDWGKIANGMIDSYPQDRLCIKGNCSEIARCFYYKYGTHQSITSANQIIALEEGWDSIPFICTQITSWFDEANIVATEKNIDILDLFYWEHRMGSWQAQSQLEWDIVQEAYAPFNHRGLLEIMLATPVKSRIAPNYVLYKLIVEALWPEVMNQPINPATKKDRLKIILDKLGMYDIANKIYKTYCKR